VVSFARVCREHGEPIRDIAQRLGLVESTLARWLRAERKQARAGFRSVAIVPCDATAPEHVDLPLRLLTPRGYSVEGLDPQTLAFLLKVVG
jgi:transposase-like protein